MEQISNPNPNRPTHNEHGERYTPFTTVGAYKTCTLRNTVDPTIKPQVLRIPVLKRVTYKEWFKMCN